MASSAAGGKKVVIAPPAIKKPDIVIKKPLVPVSPAKKTPGSKIFPAKQLGQKGAEDGKPPPPKPVLVGKKGAGGATASSGEGKPAFKKPAVVGPTPKTTAKDAGAKPSEKIPGQSTQKTGGGAAAAGGKSAPGASGGAGARQKKGKEGKPARRGGFFARLFGRREAQEEDEDEASGEEAKKVAPTPPRFENVKPRKMVGGKAGAGGGAGPPKFGPAGGRKFQPLRKGGGPPAPGEGLPEAEDGTKSDAMALKAKAPLVKPPKEPPAPLDKALAGKKSVGPKKALPAGLGGPPPLEKTEAGAPAEAADISPGGKASSPLPPPSKTAPKIAPKKPLPAGPAKPLGIAPKKIDIVPKKLPSPKKEEAGTRRVFSQLDNVTRDRVLFRPAIWPSDEWSTLSLPISWSPFLTTLWGLLC